MKPIKKIHQPILDYLEGNQDKKVSEVLKRVYELAAIQAPRNGGPTFVKDPDGVTVALLCYYFKRWFPLVGDFAVKFKPDLKSGSGYESMCEDGQDLWTEGQRVATAAHNKLLDDIAKGGLGLDDADVRRKTIEQVRRTCVKPKDKFGFKSKKLVIEHLQEIGMLPRSGNGAR